MPPLRIVLSSTALAFVLAGGLLPKRITALPPRSPHLRGDSDACRLARHHNLAAAAAELLGEARTPTVARAARGQSSTLMIVGGAAIVTGLLLDEGVITFVGAGVWLYGLYLYLR
jgi:hypothetical protein